LTKVNLLIVAIKVSKKTITFRLDENNIINDLNTSKPEKENKQRSLLEKSFLKDIEVQGRDEILLSTFDIDNFFSKSNLNQEFLEDYNIHDEKILNNFLILEIFDQINKMRTDLLSYSKMIVKYSDKFKNDKNYNYLISNEKKIYFKFNKEDFLKYAKELENLDEDLKDKNTFLEKFRYVKEIGFPLPKSKSYIGNIFKQNNLEKIFSYLKNKFRNTYNIKKLLCFEYFGEPEVPLLIQLISCFKKENKIFLNEDLKFININYMRFNGWIILFIVLSE
jgi:hypothetical protein